MCTEEMEFLHLFQPPKKEMLTSTDIQVRSDKSIKLDKVILLSFCLFSGGEVFFLSIFFLFVWGFLGFFFVLLWFFWCAEEQYCKLLSLTYCLLRQKKSETLKQAQRIRTQAEKDHFFVLYSYKVHWHMELISRFFISPDTGARKAACSARCN